MSDTSDLEAEQAVLGALLFNNSLLELTDAAGLRAAHFFDPVHARLFDQIRSLISAGKDVDAVVLKDWARTDSGMGQLGGITYLLKLLDCAAALSWQTQAYSERLIDLARRRAIIAAANEAIAGARAGDPATLAELETRLHEIDANDAGADNWKPISQVTDAAIEAAHQGKLKGLSTGFPRLDHLTGGLVALWMIGGASSMGKSMFGCAITRNVAAQGFGVGEFHLEMDDADIGARTVTALSANAEHRVGNAHYLSMANNTLSDTQWDRVRFGQAAAAKLPIWVDARPRRTLSQIEGSARRLMRMWEKAGIPPGVILIDHEGLISPEPGVRFSAQIERTNARAEGLLALQKSLGIPVIVLSQITKEGKRADGDERLPSTDDLKYGGALVEASRVTVLLHRRAYYASRKPGHQRSAEDLEALKSRDCTVIVDKARGGERGQCSVIMDLPTAAVFEPGEALS